METLAGTCWLWYFRFFFVFSPEKEANGRHCVWLYLLVAGGLQGVVLDLVLPFCDLPHLHVHLQKKYDIFKTLRYTEETRLC